MNPFVVNNSQESPYNLNYDVLGLHKKMYFITGQVAKAEYYKNYDGVTYSGLAVVENRNYVRDQNNGLVQHRNMVISFLRTDGTTGETKNTIKYYSLQDQIQEGITRRNNIISQAKAYVLNEIGLVNGEAYLSSLIDEVTMYIQGPEQPLISAISASTQSYLTPTIINTTIYLLTY